MKIKCSFTNAGSVDANVTKYLCNPKSDDCFITCNSCRGVSRSWCFSCYKNLCSALNSKETLPMREGEQLYCNDATKFVKTIDWKTAIQTKELPKEVYIDGELEDVPIARTADNLFQWTIPCQCCGTTRLPKEPLLTITNQLKPQLDHIHYHYIEIDHSVIDKVTLAHRKVNSFVELVIVDPLLDAEAITAVQHRRFGQDDDGASVVFHSKPKHWGVEKDNVYRIIATTSPSNSKELIALSTIHYDKFSETVSIEEMQAYMKLVQSSVQPTYEEGSDGIGSPRRRQCSRNSNGGYRFAHLRNCRKNGAAGTNNGMDLKDVQEAQSSPHLMGAHCRRVSSTVQLAIANKDGLITSVPNIYHASTSEKFTKSVHSSPAMKGSQAAGASLLRNILNPPAHMSSGVSRERIEEIHIEFTLARINAAHLNKAMCNHQKLNELGFSSISSEATSNVINSFEDIVRALKSETEETDKVVMEEEANEDEMLEQLKSMKQSAAYGDGEIVFYNCTNEDEWVSGGTIIKQLQTDNDCERQYLVDVGNGMQQQFGESSLSGVSGFGIYSDDDLPILSDNECHELTIRLMKITKNGLLIWSARSNYNVVFDAVAAHLDHFGSQKNKQAVKAVIENGREIPMGDPVRLVGCPIR